VEAAAAPAALKPSSAAPEAMEPSSLRRTGKAVLGSIGGIENVLLAVES
jgi:hypothetical protein